MNMQISTNSSADSEDRGSDERDVLPVPQVGGLEQVYVRDTILHASFLEPEMKNFNFIK